MTTRLQTLAASLDAPLFVTDLTNIRYLTGLDSSNAAVLVLPGGEATLYTDFRYIDVARQCAGVTVVLTRRSILQELAGSLPAGTQVEADALPYAQWEVLTSGGAKLVATRGIVEGLRAIKDAEEIEQLRRAAKVGDRVLEALTAETLVGRSEKEIAWRLVELAHAHGAEALSFGSIVAAGKNGARPHADPTDQLVERNTLVTIDWGVSLDGYVSDCTRTFSTGDLPARLREAYDVCLAAQLLACDGIKPGMTGAEADALARDAIEAAGFGAEFGHGLGHGVGMAVHEAPRLSTESTDTLEPGNAVTIEPGIYLDGLGGVRIEDLAIVREDGIELLTSFPKDLIDVS